MSNILQISVIKYILMIEKDVMFGFLYNGITIIDIVIVAGSFMFLNFEI